MILRIVFFIILLILVIVAPVALLAVCAFLYALRYTAYELIVVAGAIDAYYGLGLSGVPYYTLITIGALIVIEWQKPRFSVYNERK